MVSADQSPTAQMALPAGRIVVNQAVRFSADESTDDNGIVKYQWDMGDGTVLEGANIVHDYSTAATYNVKLTVWDSAGQSSSTEGNLKVFQTAAPHMSVKEIRMTVFYTRSYSRTESKITVTNEEGNLVSGAKVTAMINGLSVSGVTSTNGVALLKGSKIAKKAIHTLKVTEITHKEHEYDPALNVETEETIQVR